MKYAKDEAKTGPDCSQVVKDKRKRRWKGSLFQIGRVLRSCSTPCKAFPLQRVGA